MRKSHSNQPACAVSLAQVPDLAALGVKIKGDYMAGRFFLTPFRENGLKNGQDAPQMVEGKRSE